MEYDAGKVYAGLGKVIHHRFLLRNQSKLALHVDFVKASCSCTLGRIVPVIPADTVVPLDVTVRVEESTAIVEEKDIVVAFKEEGVEQLQFKIRLEPFTPVLIQPRELDFGAVEPGHTETRRVDITASDVGGNLFLIGCGSSMGSAVEITRLASGRRDTLSFEVRLHPTPQAEVGGGNITFLTTSGDRPALIVPFTYRCKDKGIFEPETLFLGYAGRSSSKDGDIFLKCHGARCVIKPGTGETLFSVIAVEHLDAGSRVRVRFLGAGSKGRYQAELQVSDERSNAYATEVSAIVD